MDAFWIAFARFSGIVVSLFGLPALVGYLAAGFVLNALSGGQQAA